MQGNVVPRIQMGPYEKILLILGTYPHSICAIHIPRRNMLPFLSLINPGSVVRFVTRTTHILYKIPKHTEYNGAFF